jgi:predicted Fe-Mo cluster-binding NifX family protein
MRICIPALDENGIDAPLSNHFGSAPFFALYDTEAKQVSTVANDNSDHIHGACMPVGTLKEHKVDAILCKGMGSRALSLLASAGVKAYVVEAETVFAAIKELEAGRAREFTADLACQHGRH